MMDWVLSLSKFNSPLQVILSGPKVLLQLMDVMATSVIPEMGFLRARVRDLFQDLVLAGWARYFLDDSENLRAGPDPPCQ